MEEGDLKRKKKKKEKRMTTHFTERDNTGHHGNEYPKLEKKTKLQKKKR